jgi:hypothetical protein
VFPSQHAVPSHKRPFLTSFHFLKVNHSDLIVNVTNLKAHSEVSRSVTHTAGLCLFRAHAAENEKPDLPKNNLIDVVSIVLEPVCGVGNYGAHEPDLLTVVVLNNTRGDIRTCLTTKSCRALPGKEILFSDRNW